MRHVSTRPILFISCLSLVLVGAFSNHASATRVVDTHRGGYTDWGPYQRAPSQPFTMKACGTSVHVTWPVDTGRLRTRMDNVSNTYLGFKGRLGMRLKGADGRVSGVINVGGLATPGGFVASADGSFLYDGLGASALFSSGPQDRIPGMPRNFVSQGPITIYYPATGRPELLREPQSYVSMCRLLNGARQPVGNHATGGYTDWSEWQSSPAGDSEYVDGCGTQVKFHVITETVQARFRSDRDGNTYIQFGQGDLIGRFVARDGRRSKAFDLSGETAPGGLVVYADSTAQVPHFLADLLGVNYTLPAAGVGVDPNLPSLNVTYGPVTAFSAGNELTPIREPQNVVDICRLLDGGDIPWEPTS